MRLNPLTVRKLKRFREIRRGYYSAVLLTVLTLVSLVAELLVSERAILVSYEGEWSFPTWSAVELGAHYGLTGVEARSAGRLPHPRRTFRGQLELGADAADSVGTLRQ